MRNWYKNSRPACVQQVCYAAHSCPASVPGFWGSVQASCLHYRFILAYLVGFALGVVFVGVLRIQHPRIADRELDSKLMQQLVERHRRHSIVLCNLRDRDGILAVQDLVVIPRLDREESIFFFELLPFLLLVREGVQQFCQFTGIAHCFVERFGGEICAVSADRGKNLGGHPMLERLCGGQLA